MEGGSNSESCLIMCFGDGDLNINDGSVVGDGGLCPMIRSMSSLPSQHEHEHFTSDTHHLPLPQPPPSSSSGASSPAAHPNPTAGCFFMETDHRGGPSSSSSSLTAVKARIMAHPLYHRLLAAYVNCQKVGAPPEVVAKLEEACASAMISVTERSCVGEDTSLDQFMEAYCEMLTKYELELSKPFKDAVIFLQGIGSQLNTLTLAPPDSSVFSEAMDRNAFTEDDDMGNGFIDPLVENSELRSQLLRKYSGYLGSLKQEFMKKRKKGKLPKEARQQLLDWWSRHSRWPYPSESQKLALAESTGLEQKQINNWFINQRKRHWKPTEDMQLVATDAMTSHHHHPHYLLDNLLGNPFLMDLSSPRLL